MSILPATYGVRDAALYAADALPSSATTKNGTGIDLGAALSSRGARLEPCELLLSAPALNTANLPDTVTAIYSIQAGADNSTFATPIATSCITQTGNTGAAAASKRIKLPSDCPRYIRASVITATNAGNCAAKSMTLELLL